ncbi:tetratricopeptide repeat protein [Marivirga tractuosa]|uniref:tetratricopeptide repeat-containing sensor histidine kinase n=1 Tax=Marivirga tractuosa TaxID=1006 RepID=UPI0035D08ED7
MNKAFFCKRIIDLYRTIASTMPVLLKYFFLLLLFLLTSSIKAQESKEKELNDLLRLFAANSTKSPQKAAEYANQMLALSIEYQLPLHTAKAHYALGNLAFKQGDFDSTIFQIRKAINYLEELEIEKGRSACYNLLAVSYKNQGKLAEAMQNFEICLQYANKTGNQKSVANAYQNISLVYFQQQKYVDAAKNLDRALAEYTSIDDYAGIISTKFNFANIMKEQGKYEKARQFYKEVLEFHQKEGNEIKEAHVGINMAQILLEEEKYEEALPQLLATKQKLETLNLEADLGLVLNDLGICMQKLARNDEAIQYFQEALLYIEENPDVYYNTELYQNLYSLYAEKGQYKIALQFLEKKVSQNEKQNSLEIEKHVASLQEQYETRLKEAQITLLEKEKSLKEVELENAAISLKKQQMTRNILFIGFLIVLTALIIIRYFYKEKIRYQQKLARKQEEINLQKTIELKKDFRLRTIEQYQEGQQQERSRIAREIHDGIGSELAGLKLAFEQYLGRESENKESQRILTGIRNACHDLRAVSHKLHPPAFAQTGFCDFLEDFINQNSKASGIDIQAIFFPREAIDALQEDLLADVYRILQELINNIIKHSKATSSELQLTLHDSYLNIVVTDDGIGIQKDASIKGIGLRNIKERLLSRNGSLEIDSSEQGTITNIDIDIVKSTEKNETKV